MSPPPIPAREVRRGEPGYPARLRGLSPEYAPETLYLRGAVDDAAPTVAIVGARAASAAALVASRVAATGLASRGATIVSGGALGVDGAAHRGALDAGGRTVVVLGTGIDVLYPARHAPLFEEVVASGGALLSQFPPGQHGLPRNFPVRNKVIAALAEVTIVIEAGERSGSLHTAAAARALGRRVLALSGSPGCERLIAQGRAEAARSPDEAVAIALGEPRPVENAPPGPRLPEDPRARKLYEALDGEPRDLGEVAARAGVPVSEALALAIDLEVGGLAARAAGGRYLRLNRGL